MLRGRDHFILTAALVSWLFSVSLYAQPAPHIEPADLQRLSGAPWKGSLTYLDYTSKKPVSIATTLVVTRADADGGHGGSTTSTRTSPRRTAPAA